MGFCNFPLVIDNRNVIFCLLSYDVNNTHVAITIELFLIWIAIVLLAPLIDIRNFGLTV